MRDAGFGRGLGVIHTRGSLGIDAPAVRVEVDLAGGLPRFTIVGLPEAAVRESRDRVRAAITNSGFAFPRGRITVSLAPAELPKEGGRYDLPIAAGVLAADGQISRRRLDEVELVGELGLGGELRAVRGALPVLLGVRGSGRSLVVPHANAPEASLVGGADVLTAGHLVEVTAHLNGGDALVRPQPVDAGTPSDLPDLADVRGQRHARRALEIAASGGHSLLLIGPPGSGKTMLAMRLGGVMPEATEDEALVTASVQSLHGAPIGAESWRRRPFRAPHHSASGVALVGGGPVPRPGEISLAHNGVLFLDELPEFSRHVLEQLREPLERRSVTISRAARAATFPADFQLVAAMNPCKCGWLGDASDRCECTADEVRRYRARISGPLLDRIDMHVEVPAVPGEVLRAGRSGEEGSATVRARVVTARKRQIDRQGVLNKDLAGEVLEQHCALDPASLSLLDAAMEKLSLSARSYHRILRLARTVADVAGSGSIRRRDVAEAVQLRCLDRRTVSP